MARARSRGAEKVHQPVEGADGLEVILQPSIESVNIRPRDKKHIRRLLWLGWMLYRARARSAQSAAREKELRAQILETMCFVTPGVAGVVSRVGGRTRMQVEIVPNVGREVKNNWVVLEVLRRRRVDVIKSLGFNTAGLLKDRKKLALLLAAMTEIYGIEGMDSLLVLDLNWAEYDKALKEGKLPKYITNYIGPSRKPGNIRVDAKPVS